VVEAIRPGYVQSARARDGLDPGGTQTDKGVQGWEVKRKPELAPAAMADTFPPSSVSRFAKQHPPG